LGEFVYYFVGGVGIDFGVGFVVEQFLVFEYFEEVEFDVVDVGFVVVYGCGFFGCVW